ncbi:YwiC-like family protein [Virgibacillus senegalensis]|uniref:YwiC-like family protein n=1 Tax=Virgibacillus senegalensis TaxID=1499679 RepID=UPI00069CD3F3|nr:YwiC-like family protein [Virgibacillus senegalensis]
MKKLLPKQHGAWAMLIIPFFLEAIAGHFTFWHLPLFLGWLSLYLTTHPFIMVFKKKRNNSLYKRGATIFGGAALLFLIPVLWIEWRLIFFGLSMLPLFLINIYFAKRKKERAFFNDVAAVITFCIGGLASYFLGTGIIDQTALVLASYNFLFFFGSIFYVKTMIREKKNRQFYYLSWIYHLLLTAGSFFIGGFWLAIAYVPSLLRAWFMPGKLFSIKQIGILEILNSIFFFTVMLVIVLS